MIAVIDCGTNTFNLLVAKLQDGHPVIVFHTKIPVRLGEGGIDKGILSEEAFKRGIDALTVLRKHIDEWNVERTLAVGTAALRDASNGKLFITACKEKTGISIDLIDGEREAELIWKAARYCVKLNGKFLVMDVGGGSNEFIIADHNRIYWKKSYRLGLSRLKETFRLNENSGPVQRELISVFLADKMHDLFEACESYDINQLIGTAGTFDTYANIFSLRNTGHEFDTAKLNFTFDTGTLIAFCELYNQMTFDERKKVQGIPDFRREFMVYATLLTATVFRNCNIRHSYLSTWSLKEGVFIETLLK
ncbi:MAG TPA: hypothetical protein VD905_10025 [Flavobacteriales bacterium]|nr:hypothetical protein [Flavobacteriales bacterium]